jgi:hypothetical protein
MGDIKQQLAAESAADAVAYSSASQTPAPASAMAVANVVPAPVQPTASKIEWRDEMPFTLTPGEGTEIKLTMAAGAKAQYLWVVEGGEVNFDTHGDAPGKSISYEKGRAVSSDEGVLEAEFTGNHGWFWRNRGKSNVTVILRTRGDYTAIKKMM